MQWHSSKAPGQPKPLFPTAQSSVSRKLARLMCGTQRYVSHALDERCIFKFRSGFKVALDLLALNSMLPVYNLMYNSVQTR